MMESHGLESPSSGQEQVAGTCVHGNVPSDSVKWGEYLD